MILQVSYSNHCSQKINFCANRYLKKMTPTQKKFVADLKKRQSDPQFQLDIIEGQIDAFNKSQSIRNQFYKSDASRLPNNQIPTGPNNARSWDEFWASQEYIKNLKVARDTLREKLGLPKIEENISAGNNKKS